MHQTQYDIYLFLVLVNYQQQKKRFITSLTMYYMPHLWHEKCKLNVENVAILQVEHFACAIWCIYVYDGTLQRFGVLFIVVSALNSKKTPSHVEVMFVEFRGSKQENMCYSDSKQVKDDLVHDLVRNLIAIFICKGEGENLY